MFETGPARAPKTIRSGRQNQLGQAMGPKGRQTRRRLLDAIEGLLSTVPVRDLRVAPIVKAARTSTATFYVYFNDVPEAVLALIGEVSQSPPNLLALMSQDWDADQAFALAHEFAASYIDHYKAHEALFRVRNLASDEGDERFTEQRINAIMPLITLMIARIRTRRDRGELPADLNPDSAAGALLAMIERIAVFRPAYAGVGVNRARLLDVAATFAVLLFSRGPMIFPDSAPALFSAKAKAPGSAATEAPLRAVSNLNPKNLNGQEVGVKGATTRRRILEAVKVLLQSAPLRDVRVSDIVREANTSNSTFYLYYQSVTEAVLAIVGEISQATPELVERLGTQAEDGCDGEAAEAFVSAYVEDWQVNRAALRIRALAIDEGDDRFAKARNDSTRELVDLLTQRVAKTQARGGLPLELHPRSVAVSFFSMLDRLAVTPNVRGAANVSTLSRAAAYFLWILLSGIPESRRA
jgi:AcrR family transcriptional regulator